MGKELSSQARSIRSFGRKFTKVMGLLDEAPYEARLGLLESRIVFEIAGAKKARAADLARGLGVDKGYLSRVLARMKKARLIDTETSLRDGRERPLKLSAKGAELFRKIDRVSSDRTQTLLRALGPAARGLSENLERAEAALSRDTIKASDFELRGLRPGDLGWVIGRHGELYAGEHGWNMDFEALVAEVALGFVKKNDPRKERAWIAELNGTRLGCVFVVRQSVSVAWLRILLVDPAARGLGLGTRLVKECIAFARARGYSKITLWTNDVLVSARKIYEAEGFRLDKENRHKSFGKELVGQTWSLQL